MLLPLQGANPNIHRPRALPWARCLLAFQAVTSQKLYRTPIINNMSSWKIGVIREIRVLLNIENLVFSVEYLWGGLYEYNYPSNKELSIFTGQFPLPKANKKRDITFVGYVCPPMGALPKLFTKLSTLSKYKQYCTEYVWREICIDVLNWGPPNESKNNNWQSYSCSPQYYRPLRPLGTSPNFGEEFYIHLFACYSQLDNQTRQTN